MNRTAGDCSDDLSKQERETLKAIHRQNQMASPSESHAHTGELAEELGVSAATVSATNEAARRSRARRPHALPRRRLETLGLRPGVRVEVQEKHAFDGPLVLVVAGHDRTLGSTVARQVFVRRQPA